MFNIIDEKTDGGIHDREFTLMGDFEIMGFNFLSDKVKRKCCQFHFCQCIERKSKKIRSSSKEERKMKNRIKKELMALSILPMDAVEDTFKYIKEKYGQHPLIEYFEKNFMTNKQYPIDSWNVNKEEHRTNNISESFNRELRHYFKRSNYFSGGKRPRLMVFEAILFGYMDYKSKCKSMKVSSKRNIVSECKTALIMNLSKHLPLFKTMEDLLFMAITIMKLGKHKAKKEEAPKETEAKNVKVGVEKKEETQVIIDEEYFEIENVEDIDNIDGEDGIGNDINEGQRTEDMIIINEGCENDKEKIQDETWMNTNGEQGMDEIHENIQEEGNKLDDNTPFSSCEKYIEVLKNTEKIDLGPFMEIFKDSLQREREKLKREREKERENAKPKVRENIIERDKIVKGIDQYIHREDLTNNIRSNTFDPVFKNDILNKLLSMK